ncbi:ABC transporter ATP-binding protein [Enterococcus sp. 669A]|uniref:ABC transporter ATP-binding protein n=1 Tax=Candidatus Enterococcus moelleringii TaxID=2815325 RepID=A0ABS3LEJ9_9ENTE|nr:ABC transporter ATP-binding protein [Enterococcus sp. 669A]MBO1308057.1 ABC transporter ATP-binding protein [Enterococcus sp. 669A]
MKHVIKNHKLLLVITLLFSIISSITAIYAAFLLRDILNAAITQDDALFRQTVLLTIIYLPMTGLLQWAYSYFSKKFIYQVIQDLRQEIFDGILNRDASTFHSTNTADYISAVTNDIKILEDNYLVPLLDAIRYGFVFAATLIALIYTSPLITVVMIVCLLALIIIPSIFGNPLQKRQDLLSQNYTSLTVRLKDLLSGYEVIQSFQMLPFARKSFHQQNQQTAKSKFSVDKLYAANEGISTVLGAGTQFVNLIVAAYFVLNGEMTAGVMLALLQLSGTFVQPAAMILESLPKIQGAKPVAARIDELAAPVDSPFKGTEVPTFEKTIQLKQLAFSYEEKPVIQDLNLTLEKNKKYALVGPSGCGKTTLARLITANFGNYQGEIRFDDQELKELDVHQIPQYYSMIHQNVYMFDESIGDNITLHQERSAGEIGSALFASGAKKFIDSLPAGLETPAGENGNNLSGGQRQRVAVARALIQNKPLLILDEGTSAVDSKTAYDIETRLLQLPELTLLTITHNLSEELLGQYDAIIYMEEGKIIQVGTYEELSKNQQFADFASIKQQEQLQVAAV